MSSMLKTSDSGGDSLIHRRNWLSRNKARGTMNREDDVTAEELGPLATRAVDELIADVESGSFRETARQLAEVIISCIRHTRPTQLRTLKWFLKQRALG
jgi:hypothetical protein